MGCDGIFDQMNNDEIIDCAWMILNNKNNNEEKIWTMIVITSKLILKIIIFMKNVD